MAQSCPVCWNMFTDKSKSEVGDRRPVIVCDNGDTICVNCFTERRAKRDTKCPTCEGKLRQKPAVNKAILEVVETFSNILHRTVEDSLLNSHNFVTRKPNVYNVAVKVVASHEDIDRHIKEIKNETNLAIGLHHLNVIRLFGTTLVMDNELGILTEKAEHGSLKKWIGKLDEEKAVEIALGIVNGLDYLHSRRVIHCDVKPQNILMCGPSDDIIPKIADIGVSKVIRSVTINTAMGTPLYMAPEVRSVRAYGSSADIFSLSMMLFEMFSGQPPARHSSQPLTQYMFSVISGKTNEISERFPVPAALRDVIELGWRQNPEERPGLREYKEVLEEMVNKPTSADEDDEIAEVDVTRDQQAQEIAEVNIAIPVLEMGWSESCEALNSKELRHKMIEDIKTKSNMASAIIDPVLCAMKVVPSHLFVEASRLERGSQTAKQEVVKRPYIYNKPFPTTTSSDETPPEVIGMQLSMMDIIQGQSVLLVGTKGGYIQSLIAQLVGINGSLVTVTEDDVSMKVCQERINLYCPWKSNIDWIKVANIQDHSGIVEELERVKKRFHTIIFFCIRPQTSSVDIEFTEHNAVDMGLITSDEKRFHTIIYCSAVDDFPSEMKEVLCDGGNVSIMAPVKVEGGIKFQLHLRRGKVAELRTITDFGIISADAH